MPAPDAVAAVAVSRAEVRKSINRLEYHLNRGTAGARGVRREIAYLDALHRQTVRLSGLATGQPYTSALGSFGEKAAVALNSGNTRTIGRVKSSILADYSSDGLQPARDWTLVGGREWVWVANASACPTCLAKHGRTYSGPFVPSHPSCLCIPETRGQAQANGVTQLSGETVGEQLLNYGDPRYYSKAQELKNGTLNLGDVQNIENVNGQARGRAAWEAHMRKQEVYRVDGAPPVVATDATATAAPTTAPATTTTEVATSAVEEATTSANLSELADDVMAKASKKMRKVDQTTFRNAVQIADDYISSLPTSVQAKYRDALAEVLTFRPEVLRDIPKSGRMVLGHWAPFNKVPRRGIVRKELMIQFKRVDDEAYNAWTTRFNKWAKDNNGAFDAAKREFPAEPSKWHDAAAAHKRAFPAPDKPATFIVDATADDVASTLIHELTHIIDTASNQTIRKQAQGVFNKVSKLFDQDGVEEFWYAASRDSLGRPMYGETVAELSRFYIEGWPAKQVTAQQWRATYPDLAQFVEEVIYA